ncbi:LacI family DNA-binding transcriptional regulator [Curtobacterium sp. MCBD17_040]|uniref:LacI family DNA-binding transcriptional regulator n=1 Tax=Curtobacterium sp. MCBD17_040 TaxID=2175674 RepID=UPI0015E8AFBD|nr:LacI family DNA-binding transcriptional regulator [Curtobacterium sp. MCBD17_040]WIB63208.1 LacI family DNA-binding transcriptional regulator [Curtobacterium sp. MCBD17_040]
MDRRRVGIKDVAAEAGVSVTTVSHILNDVDFLRASEETRERVKDAAKRLGYGPNRMARGLRMQRSEMIGLLSEEIATTPHAGRIILGAQNAARRHGLTLVIINTERDDVAANATALIRQQVDGVLYATMFHREITPPTELDGIPTVVIDSTDRTGTHPAVAPNERGGARAAMQELLTHGHRRIGFMNNVDDVPATRERLAGYRESLQQAGIAIDEALVHAAPSESPGGYEAARALLGLADRPTALFCYNDRMAMGAYRAAAEMGLRIPQDVSIVGFDNQEIIAEGLFPALTTVALPHYEMGEWALERLVQLQGGSPADDHTADTEPVFLPCPIVRRESIATPPR